jgi:hypothetical protein
VRFPKSDRREIGLSAVVGLGGIGSDGDCNVEAGDVVSEGPEGVETSGREIAGELHEAGVLALAVADPPSSPADVAVETPRGNALSILDFPFRPPLGVVAELVGLLVVVNCEG